MTTWASSEHPPISGYEPIRVLGRNGAIVYLAHSLRFEKPVVLQVWSNRTLPVPEAVLVGLDHQNILGVLDVGEVAGHVYVALEYLEGGEILNTKLRRGPMPESDARGLALIMASVLQFLRERSVTVASLTPRDVLIGETPKLMLHWRWGHYGRPDFMAPEEWPFAQGAPPTVGYGSASGVETGSGQAAAIDVYRVGALLYAMLTAGPPVCLDSVRGSAWQSAPVPVPVREINPAISNTLEAVCMKSLTQRPLDRYASLEELIASLTGAARAPGPAWRPP
jgi:serine/threonine protein kinase